MTRLVLLGGPPGVGKTTTLKLLQDRLPRSAILDADDVWRISEDLAVEGTRAIAISNVVDVIDGYLAAGCESAVLSWVFARPQLYEPVIKALRDSVDEIHQVYLVASPEALRNRLEQRNCLDRLDYSLDRLQLITALPYPRIDTTRRSPEEAADSLLEHIRAL